MLGATVDVGIDHPNYTKSKKIKTAKSQKIVVSNSANGKQSEMILSREGLTDKTLGALMVSPNATREQKDTAIAQYLFERGRESGSFLAELYVSKGVHVKETQAFKRQVRFDFESFANTMVILLQDMAKELRDPDQFSAIEGLADRMEQGADLLISQREKITSDRLREKGYGVYIDQNGKAYSIFEDEIEGAVKADKEALQDNQQE